ncbi:hypothetical protein, partial [Streptomyces sp. NPDC127084]|uniref:hypothetical protein n=1 Tax=Streptomyces sp. NPDC127084 TaxID=3347133 RepID=UPI003669253C
RPARPGGRGPRAAARRGARRLLARRSRRGIPAVVVCGPYWRDSGLPDLPYCVPPVFVEDECGAEAVLTALTRVGLGERCAS